ncbi:MAG: DUF2961 domain-containing protein [Armatimonadetes bacterium]|nr:DUF2961 domain-containing protein [Armatimonadota bacterium]MDE2205582.1 DUF2961 domain-containing protein [Armatimonadota bacterium]
MILLAILAGLLQTVQNPLGTPIDGPGSTLSLARRIALPNSPAMPYGLQLMARFDLLPTLRDTRCVQDSSYDRSGGNGDSGNFFARKGNVAVLADIRGPGCIYRFWSANAQGRLRIYFDGQKAPTIDCPMQDLFLGKVAPFVQPLVGHKSGGFYCYFPMAFQKHCRIEVTDPGSLYYHVQYQLFPDNQRIRTFTTTLTRPDQLALQTVLAQWNHLGSDPKPPPAGELMLSGTVAAVAGQDMQFARIDGPAVIDAIRMRVLPANRFTLRQTVFSINWDGSATPAVQAPIGDFFGSGLGDVRFAAMPDAMTDQGYVCYWPMPFSSAAAFKLHNYAPGGALEVQWQIQYHKTDAPPKGEGWFQAQWHRETTVAGHPFHILDTDGRGQYVGEHTDMQGDRGIWFLEGDEQIWVDGDTFPSIHGTGTEDFYTAGWYFDEGTFNEAYHGCVVKQEAISRVGAYRYQIQDCVPFQHHIRVNIEHGPENDYPGADYSCVAYWYQDTPGHTWSPIDPTQLTPPRLKLAGVIEAESLGWSGGSTQQMSDDTFAAQASGAKVESVAGGPAIATINSPAAGVSRVTLSMMDASDAAHTFDVSVNGGPMQKVGTTADPDVPGRLTASFGGLLASGANKLTFTVPTGGAVYLDYLQLDAAPHEKGVAEAEDYLSSVHPSAGTTVSRVDKVGSNWSGWSALQWSALRGNSSLSLPFEVHTAGSKSIQLGVIQSPLEGKTQVSIDGLPAGTFGPLPATWAGTSHRMFLGQMNLSTGEHLLTFARRIGSTIPLTLDYFAVKSGKYPFSVEAEDLKVLSADGGDASTQQLPSPDHAWSGDAQFWFVADHPNASATLQLPVAAPGKYTLVVYFTTAKDYAQVQTLVDGAPVGPVVDCYTPTVRPKGRTVLGEVTLSAGDHKITFRAAGKNAASTNYLIGVDAIGLEPVK